MTLTTNSNTPTILCCLFLIVGTACSDETTNEPIFTEEDFFQQTKQYTSCTTMSDCRHVGLYWANPCLCDLAYNADFDDEVFELMKMVECSEEKNPQGFECVSISDFAICNTSGICAKPPFP